MSIVNPVAVGREVEKIISFLLKKKAISVGYFGYLWYAFQRLSSRVALMGMLY